jgi:hypothetical protein
MRKLCTASLNQYIGIKGREKRNILSFVVNVGKDSRRNGGRKAMRKSSTALIRQHKRGRYSFVEYVGKDSQPSDGKKAMKISSTALLIRIVLAFRTSYS